MTSFLSLGVSVLPNNQGLDQIISNLEAPTIVSSAGILERALRQVDDYDYMVGRIE